MSEALTILVNGRNVCYEDSQKKTQPVIFVHGFPFHKGSWRPQFDFLKEKYRAIIYDLPGFGSSAPLVRQARIELYAEHLIQFMDALRIRKAICCGLSMGGCILLNAVTHYPQRFSAIMLCDTPCGADTKENARKRFDHIAQIEEEGPKKFVNELLKTLFCMETAETKEKRKELIRLAKKMILSNKNSAITAGLKAMARRKDSSEDLKHIKLPTLVICGENDTIIPIKQSEFLFSHIPNSEFHIIEKAAHLSNLEQADEFNRHLNNFILDLAL